MLLEFRSGRCLKLPRSSPSSQEHGASVDSAEGAPEKDEEWCEDRH